ncbi:hypothetical protein CHUAL_000729 [Chamberlinius hualienensis]
MATCVVPAAYRGPELYDFLVEAELQHYYNALKQNLKVNTVPQLKYVEDDDMLELGMSKPEMRRLKKYLYKYSLQTYFKRLKKMLKKKEDDGDGHLSVNVSEGGFETPGHRAPSKHMISADSITINKELGYGEFGIVQQGVWTNEDGVRIQVAIKRLSKDKMQNNSMDFLKEASIMHSIDHEHIVRLYGVVLETDSLMLVTELAPLRSLLECLKEPALRPSFPVVALCEFALQICDGMRYLENNRLIHRDLAARNILVFSKNKVKISDFGLSRALGVGKNYYQTNFNVNLKLPIAWCAPECINYLRFTSASDVWAYAVTLWEMFSYGFQPWAALTGQQILEAIDEPNFHRLEQPELCPKDYYSLMIKCWQHDPNWRPTFSEIQTLLPEYKPEQYLAIKNVEETAATKGRREFLVYKINDVITVLDKKPSLEGVTYWKGVLANGKCGLFNPANTVAYLGTEIPSMGSSFVRPDHKSSLYSSRRRLKPEMISGPQGDLKHTGHVGVDGAFFGDVSFLSDKYNQLPKQVVTPYKPHEDQDSALWSKTSTEVSDRAPLLTSRGKKIAPGAEAHWLELQSVVSGKDNRGVGGVGGSVGGQNGVSICYPPPRRTSESGNSCCALLADHEYHVISDAEEEEEGVDDDEAGNCDAFATGTIDDVTSTNLNGDVSGFEAYFQKLDLGPSLMDEVLTAFDSQRGTSNTLTSNQNQTFNRDAEGITLNSNVQNQINELASQSDRPRSFSFSKENKKRRSSVKPISPSDAKTIETAIAIAKEVANRNMQEMDSRSETSDTAADSPRTPSSPSKKKFSFRFPGKSSGSPKNDKRNFTAEAASKPNIQDSLTESAKEAYNSLVEKKGHDDQQRTQTLDSPTEEDTNPLRMLRSGGPVRPKVRGNKHCGRSPSGETHSALLGLTSKQSYSMENVRVGGGSNGTGCHVIETSATLPRSSTSTTANSISHHNGHNNHSSHQNGQVRSNFRLHENGNSSSVQDDTGVGSCPNLLPLPPRDRTRTIPHHKPRQRKYPLIIPVGNTKNLVKPPNVNVDEDEFIDLADGSVVVHEPLFNPNRESTAELNAPVKPPRLQDLDDSFDGQIQADMDSLDDIPEEEAPIPPIYRNSDHVSCEDLLDFACDFPNAKRTQGRALGIGSDEVRIMQKVLKNEVTAEECVDALNETDWDVHRAIKYLKLQLMLSSNFINTDNCKQTLMSCSWDVQKAYNYFLTTYGTIDDSTEV